MKSGAMVLALSMLSTLLVGDALADAQRPPTPGVRPSTRPAPPPPTIRTPIQPPVAQPAPPITQLPTTPPSAQQSSPFDARPRTYAPRYDPRYNRNPRRGGYYAPYYSGGFSLDDVPQAADAGAFPADGNGQPTVSLSLQVPSPVVLPHTPDTYYVIPGCYAGNHPPNKDRLPKGCDVANLKTTPVR